MQISSQPKFKMTCWTSKQESKRGRKRCNVDILSQKYSFPVKTELIEFVILSLISLLQQISSDVKDILRSVRLCCDAIVIIGILSRSIILASAECIDTYILSELQSCDLCLCVCLKERETTSEKAPQQRNAHTNTQMSHSYCHRTGFITNNSLGSDVETRFGNDDSVICVCDCLWVW